MNIAKALKPKPKSLKRRLVGALLGSVYATAVLGAGLFFLDNQPIDAMPAPHSDGQAADAMDIREPVKNAPSTVLDAHRAECWTKDESPKAELPGAAIVQFASGKAVYVTNDTDKGFKIVDAAFAEALASIGFGEHAETLPFDRVIGLCK